MSSGLIILVFLAAFIGGAIAVRYKQPVLVGYIIGGIIAGNLVPAVRESASVNTVADLGITLLLFTVGTEAALSSMAGNTVRLILPAFFQMTAVSLICLGIGVLAGWPPQFSWVLAALTAFSSTAIVVTILSEKDELESIPGQNALTILVLQDLTVMPFLLAYGMIFGGHENTAGDILSVISKICLAGLIFLAVRKYGIRRWFVTVAGMKSRELFLIFIILFIGIFMSVFSFLGLPLPIGAFLCGLLVSGTMENHAVVSEIRSLRSLFSVVFFTAVGMTLSIPSLFSHIALILVLLLFVSGLKFVTHLLFIRLDAFHRKTTFLSAVYLLPISEFGFVIARQAWDFGSIDDSQYAVVISVVLFSVIFSAPLISNAHRIFYRYASAVIGKLPRIFPRPVMETGPASMPYSDHVVVCGSGRVGKYIVRALHMTGIPCIVIDYNHSVISRLTETEDHAVYGDPADIDILRRAFVDRARALVIAIPDMETKARIITNALTLNSRVNIICRSHREAEQKDLKNLGVHTVIQPEFEAALAIVAKLADEYDLTKEELSGKISRLKIEHGMG